MSFGIIVDAKKRKEELKAKGLADCSVKESLSIKPDLNTHKAQRRQFAEKIARNMGRQEVLKAFPSFVNTFCRKGGK